ncbi:non-SMC mitotic condensation complex subunit 1-domain-containing protein [Dichotomocladium elegans]|nr:non-SMC mitotic condensation complex subunit 1-domain-containing protein [Dichotomocladium elegans]
MYGGELDLEDWQRKLDKIKEELAVSGLMHRSDIIYLQTKPKDAEIPKNSEEKVCPGNEDIEMKESSANTEETTKIPHRAAESNTGDSTAIRMPDVRAAVISVEKIQQLTLMRTFHMDAVKLIQQIHQAIPVICQLLSSKSKPEVLEAMDFLMTAYNYKVKPAADGIKKMLHLIWTKDTSDEGKGIKMKLLDCYKKLYLEYDARLSSRDNINAIAKNLIQLTFHTTLAELTSLEQLLCTVMIEDPLPEAVIDKLWAVYGFTKASIPKSQRRGAIIILGMLAKAKTDVVSEKVDVMLRVGLGPLGKTDLSLAKYTCIALQRLNGIKSAEKGRSVHEGARLPMHHAIFPRLKDIIESPTDLIEWFSVTEEALNTIYLLGEHPDILCAEIIRNKTVRVLGERGRSETPLSTDDAAEAMDIDYDMSMSQQAFPIPKEPVFQSSTELSQLVFLVGHVALKQIVHLEFVEAAWKKISAKKNGEFEKTLDSPQKADGEEEELEQVGGTAEDDIGETITHIREREVLFGPNSLLARFGPMLTEICVRNKIYTDRTLQMMATLSLAKFMCRSKDATIRSNIVIALGDMAVCFNTIIDENISFLYNRLSDESNLVKKNAVMVLTHLILNGMVKVKGQISEMARCVEDPDQRIADLAKLFFTELATKDNAIYNNLPDIISNLTNCEPKVEEEKFRRIMRFIFSFEFADKEKHAENVVDKLCMRFANTDDERIWRDIAFCLSLLPFKSERSFKKLMEGLPNYQDKLHEESVLKSFQDIIAKGRLQKVAKPELKAIIDELDQKLQKHCGNEKTEEDDISPTQPKKAPMRQKRSKCLSTKKKANDKLTQKRKRRTVESENESEDDLVLEDDDDEDEDEDVDEDTADEEDEGADE